MNLETKITIYKFTPQVFTLTQNYGEIKRRLYHYGRAFGIHEAIAELYVPNLEAEIYKNICTLPPCLYL